MPRLRWTWTTLIQLLCWCLLLVQPAWTKSTVPVTRKEGISTGYVDALQGHPAALTLSYFLTGPGDLHYAIVPHGHNALAADAIKAAAVASPSSPTAGTFTSTTATRLAWNVLTLEANTTYDVYFVAEASNSNGVFGTVVSINGTTTHPHAPRLTLQHSEPVRASSSSATFKVNMSAPGLLHYIVVPTSGSHNMSAVDIWSSNQSLSLFIPSTDAVMVNMTDLDAFTPYDVWLTTEVKGSDGVLGAVVHGAEAFTTHAVAPDVVHVGCLPRGGTTSELLVGLRLQFSPNAFANVHAAALRAVQYSIWYVADAAASGGYNAPGAIQNATNTTTRQAGLFHLSIPAQDATNVHIVAATDTTVDLHANISALQAGTNYSLAVVVETKGSRGLFGSVFGISGCGTHPVPPKITSVHVAAQARTTDTAVMHVAVEALTNVHFVLGTPLAFRQVPHTFAALSTTYNASFFRIDSVAGVHNATNITLTALNASTIYAVAVFAETVNSFGVYGTLSVPVTEFRTNDPAGNVTIVEATPVLGSTTNISVKVQLTQPQNYVALCWKPAAPVAFTCVNHTGNLVVGNFTPGSTYELYVVASTLQHVQSAPSDLVTVSTHAAAPLVDVATLDRIDGRYDQLLAKLATSTSGWLHTALFKADALEGKPSLTIEGLVRQQVSAHHQSAVKISATSTRTEAILDNLAANTTYTLVVFAESESATNDTGSQVYGELHFVNLTTYELAPTILQSAALPHNASTDTIFLVANLSSPGRLHYMITDKDLHDPKVLNQPVQPQHPAAFVRRGMVDVTAQVWTTVNETRNGVNVTIDVALPIFNANHTIPGLVPDTMYHVFLTTETFDSHGVFGALIAPHLATTHAPHPTFTSLAVLPTAGNAKSISLNLTLSRYGLVHYILLLRTVPDTNSTASADKPLESLNGTSAIDVSEIDSATLSGGLVQRASISELGAGVVHNGSIPISREDWAKVDTPTHKAFGDLISGATYELCVVAETDASNGVFGPVKCHVVTTFVDHSNATLLFDVKSAEPVAGRTDQVELTWRKLSGAPIVPYFVLAQGGHATFSTNSFGRTPFSEIQPGQHGVVAAGALPLVQGTTDTYRIVVEDLDPHTAYSCYFSGETVGSFGVFTQVNNSFPVTTHAPPPVLSSYFARPATGNSTGVEVVVDVGCPKSVHCNDALVHVVVAAADCPRAPTVPFHLAQACVLAYAVHNVSISGATIAKQHVVFLEDSTRMAPNTTYTVRIATETPESHGVFSSIKSTSVTTHPTPPTFVDLGVYPKHASTTELVLNYQLSTPGVVHLLIGEDSKHIDVSSVYNISARKFGAEDWHKYPPQTIAYRRTLTVPTTSPRTETLGYLTANTSYTVWVVAETAADANLYTPIAVFANVSTFAPAPLLLSHAASPTPGSTTHLRLQYTTNDATGVVHCLVAASTLWKPTLAGPIQFGNRIGYNTNVVAQVSLANETGVVDIPVPFPDTNYTLYLVTETSRSNGVFGVVAQLDNIKSSAPAPDIVDVRISATDARTDALTVDVRLNRAGIVHYSLAEANRPLDVTDPPPSVVANSSSNVSFVVTGLKESTLYDLYFQTETLGSGGVVGPLVRVPSPVPTHGPPPVVLEEVDCSGAPNCDALGREPCWLVSNTCGECRDGFAGDDTGPSNAPCVAGTKKKGKKTIGIKISGVKQPQPSVAEVEVHATSEAVDMCPTNAHMSLDTNRCECIDGYAMDSNNACVQLCPPNSSMSAPGRCQCDPGFVLDALQTSCVLQVTGSSSGLGSGGVYTST